MNESRNKTGWIKGCDVRISHTVSQDARTKFVPSAIDLDDEERQTAVGLIGVGDRTVVAKSNPAPLHKPSRRSAQYIPVHGLRQTGEATKIWCLEDDRRIAKILGTISSKLRHFQKPRTLLLLAGCLLTVGLVIFGTRESKMSTALPDYHRKSFENTGPGGSPPVAPSGKQDSSVEKKGPIRRGDSAGGEGAVSLRQVADALAEGRLNEAFELYKALRRQFPDDPSHSLALRSLERWKKGRDK